MTNHEKSIFIISELGIAPKKIAEIIKPGLSAVYSKLKGENRNAFTVEDFTLLKEYVLKKAQEIDKL
ncbi:hypothetical protein MKJ01_05365 [Chryseobacterium sp. SSA4.19]|uniref:hypothetical protein n=1 Tax=Chryseobacterium sp. SSA4.19 TaxID=2919915 RepID=UPI001F4D8A4B|nr:hypothetical protein [Chryseobacterium sp. SSA4.19]MCJ8153189.1 hypothetical protein [Chryseobacterium sp. SSA4.19]